MAHVKISKLKKQKTRNLHKNNFNFFSHKPEPNVHRNLETIKKKDFFNSHSTLNF